MEDQGESAEPDINSDLDISIKLIDEYSDYQSNKSNVEFVPYDQSKLPSRGVRSRKQNLVEATSSDYCMTPNLVEGCFSPPGHSEYDSDGSTNERISVKSLVNSFNKQIASYKDKTDKISDKSSVDHGNLAFITYTSSLEEINAPTDRTLMKSNANNDDLYTTFQQQNSYANYIDQNNFNNFSNAAKPLNNGHNYSLGYNNLLYNDLFDVSYMAEKGMLEGFNYYNDPNSKLNNPFSSGTLSKYGRRQSISSKNNFSVTDRIFVIKRGFARICWEPEFEWTTTGVAIFECDQSNNDKLLDQFPHSNISNSPTFNLSNSPLFHFSNPEHYERDEYNFSGSTDSDRYLITYSDPTLWDVSKTITTGAYTKAFRIENYGDRNSFTLFNIIRFGMEKLFQPFLLDETWSSFKAYPLEPANTSVPLVSDTDSANEGKPCKLFVEFIEEFKNSPQPPSVRHNKPTSVKDLTLAVNVFSLVKKRQ